MTREEAISLIKSAQLMLINPTTNEPVSDLHMALEMAIKALSQEPCDKCKYFDGNSCQHYDYKVGYTQGYEDASNRFGKEPCDDTVSRGVFEQVRWERDIAIEQLNELGYELGQKIEPCTDAVSREAVLGAICDYVAFEEYEDKSHTFTIRPLTKRIKQLPSVTQKSGKWIEDAKTYYEELNKRGLGVDEYTPYFTDDIACSECLAKYNTLDNETQFFKYCPNCGAKMESSNDKIDK